MRILLWSCPRNLSTALMYAFAQRSDTQVFDESLYGHYLARTTTQHPMHQELLEVLETDGEKVVQDVILGDFPKPVLFYKLMTHFLVDLDMSFLFRSDVKNVVFFRNPIEIIHSYNKVIPNPNIDDIGLKKQVQLCQELQAKGKLDAVVDAEYLRKDPAAALAHLCQQLGIPFEEQMLSWEKGGIPEDGVWAPYWYHNIHNSTGFKPYTPKEIHLPTHLQALADEATEYYLQLKSYE